MQSGSRATEGDTPASMVRSWPALSEEVVPRQDISATNPEPRLLALYRQLSSRRGAIPATGSDDADHHTHQANSPTFWATNTSPSSPAAQYQSLAAARGRSMSGQWRRSPSHLHDSFVGGRLPDRSSLGRRFIAPPAVRRETWTAASEQSGGPSGQTSVTTDQDPAAPRPPPALRWSVSHRVSPKGRSTWMPPSEADEWQRWRSESGMKRSAFSLQDPLEPAPAVPASPPPAGNVQPPAQKLSSASSLPQLPPTAPSTLLPAYSLHFTTSLRNTTGRSGSTRSSNFSSLPHPRTSAGSEYYLRSSVASALAHSRNSPGIGYPRSSLTTSSSHYGTVTGSSLGAGFSEITPAEEEHCNTETLPLPTSLPFPSPIAEAETHESLQPGL